MHLSLKHNPHKKVFHNIYFFFVLPSYMYQRIYLVQIKKNANPRHRSKLFRPYYPIETNSKVSWNKIEMYGRKDHKAKKLVSLIRHKYKQTNHWILQNHVNIFSSWSHINVYHPRCCRWCVLFGLQCVQKNWDCVAHRSVNNFDPLSFSSSCSCE